MFGLRSLGIESNIVALGDSAVIEEHPDRLVIRTPSEPDYWDGNKVTFRNARLGPEALIARFQADFPDAAHISVEWDIPDMPLSAKHEELESLGFSVDRSDVLACDGPPAAAPAPKGVETRIIETQGDWAQVEELQFETGMEDGYDPVLYRSFIAGRTTMRRRQSEAGRGAWFGAFDGALLVGDLGLMLGQGIARFQAVETRVSHRGRGICPALLRFAADWALNRVADPRFVIIADAGGMPARLYRRQGFAPVETFLGALRPPKNARAEP